MEEGVWLTCPESYSFYSKLLVLRFVSELLVTFSSSFINMPEHAITNILHI